MGSPPETVRIEDVCPPPQRSQTRWRGMDGWRLNGFPHLLHFGFAHCGVVLIKRVSWSRMTFKIVILKALEVTVPG